MQSSNKFFKRYTSDLVRWVELNGSKGSGRIKTVEKPSGSVGEIQQVGGVKFCVSNGAVLVKNGSNYELPESR